MFTLNMLRLMIIINVENATNIVLEYFDQDSEDYTIFSSSLSIDNAVPAINPAALIATTLPASKVPITPLENSIVETIVSSVSKTGKCIIIHEAPFTGGYGGEISSLVQERCFYHLQSPIKRVTGWDTPFPHTLEWSYLPSQERIKDALEESME